MGNNGETSNNHNDNNSSCGSLLLTGNHLATWTTDSHCSYHGESFHFTLGLAHEDGHVLFDTSSFCLHRGTVTGLVGTNGSGKSSLASVLASKQLPGFPSHLSVTLLGDCLSFSSSASMTATTTSVTNDEDEDIKMNMRPQEYLRHCIQQRLSSVEQDIAKLEDQFEEDPYTSEDIVARLSHLYDVAESTKEMAEREMQSILVDELGFSPSLLDKKLCHLSSGWLYKCRLVAALLNHADLIIVDEPTFLDVKSMTWLVERINNKVAKQENAMVILISHKKDLLDRLCHEHILYINAASKTLTQYHIGNTNASAGGGGGGGYSAFLEIHAAQVEFSRRAVQTADQKVSAADHSLQQVQAKLRVRERHLKEITTQHADQRFIKGKCKESKQKADRSATSKVKLLKKQQAEIQSNLHNQTMTENVKPIHIRGSRPGASTLAVLENVTVSYHDPNGNNNNNNTNHSNNHDDTVVFEHVELRLEPTDRILLVGDNGCGKSTLIRVLLGELEPTQGTCRTSMTQRSCLYFPQTALQDLVRHHGSESAMEFLLRSFTANAATSVHGNRHVDVAGSPPEQQQQQQISNSNTNPLASWTATQVRQHLGEFGLTRSAVLRPIRALSAGQRVRLWLAHQSAMAKAASPGGGLSLLILDEISENVDTETRHSLVNLINNTHPEERQQPRHHHHHHHHQEQQQARCGWEGAVIVVSHDPDFCRDYRPTQIWHLHRDGMRVEYPDS
ncbi:hypothetical protein ACA910_017822 [Epithemia clementina (nom. ined.)]